MLSDEEIRVIADFKKKYEEAIKEDYIFVHLYKRDVNILIKLIEKQFKEIEVLSDKLTEKICKGVEEEILEEYRQTIISKDKEIEELKKYQEGYKLLSYGLDNYINKDKIKPIQIIDLDGKIHNVYKIEEV